MKHQLVANIAGILVLMAGGATAGKAPARAKATTKPSTPVATTQPSAPAATPAAAAATPPTATADDAGASTAAPAVILEPAEDQAPAMVLREKQFFYGSFGLRDPFRSLVGGDFEPAEQELVDLHTVQLVGMLWEDAAYVGIVQDAQGFGWALRPGDPVRNGVVVSVTRTELVGRLNIFGMVDRVNLRLQRVRDEE